MDAKTPTINVAFKFRWPVFQKGDREIEIRIPTGGDVPVINPEFAEMMTLSRLEIDSATQQVLREIAIIR